MSSSSSHILRPAKAAPSGLPLLSPRSSRRSSQLPDLRRRRPPVLRAVISRKDNSVSTLRTQAPGDLTGAAAAAAAAGAIEVRVVLTVRNKIKERLSDKVEGQWESFINGIGQGITVQLVGEDIDPETGSVKKSARIAVRGWLPKPANHSYLTEYAANFSVPSDFGRPGAVTVTNLQSKEFYLMELVVHGFADGPIFFPANSWIHSQKDCLDGRLIFSNQAYLPSQTPPGLKKIRQEVLNYHCGNGKGERKKFEQIYDYAKYNDLGNPDKDSDLARPLLSGRERPYPRRCRTGRPPTQSDPCAESRVEKPDPVYVPRDENFEEIKQETFSSGSVRALFHNLVPALVAALSRSDREFECFSDIDKLYKDGIILKNEGERVRMLLPEMLKNVMTMGEKLLKYDVPSIISRDRFSWLRDNEFARQMLAGVNPVSIERLREFPIVSKLDPSVYGSPESAITKDCLENELHGMAVEEAIENHRLYILDYHDLLLPFMKKINSIQGRKTYASRTILLHTHNGILRPIAIELSLPSRKMVYTHGHDATTNWIWKLAKAHVFANDAGVHQLVNHWLRTHACMEPYIIASHRQLSTMHPIFKLLHPHMRYTLEINALARQSLINGGGIIESCFTPGRYSMELSSTAYKTMWRFDMEALPADLIRRGMAVEDSSMPGGIKLVIEDYPYAADGILIWSAIQDWVHDYVSAFYSDDDTIASDSELQSWWDEIKNKGHEDKKHEPWWPTLDTRESLTRILSTIIWTASGQHAAINFGQYPFGGFMPNRPTLMKKHIPLEGEPEENCPHRGSRGTLRAGFRRRRRRWFLPWAFRRARRLVAAAGLREAELEEGVSAVEGGLAGLPGKCLLSGRVARSSLGGGIFSPRVFSMVVKGSGSICTMDMFCLVTSSRIICRSMDIPFNACGRLVCDSCCTACQRLWPVGGKIASSPRAVRFPTVRCHVGSLFFGMLPFRRQLFELIPLLFDSGPCLRGLCAIFHVDGPDEGAQIQLQHYLNIMTLK
ncbi:Lipoxygenase 6, chloroplastic [Apostasia shenzhenica]|uniref:Lipoxygenase n=1 Tax=Apostasia shenzhenica TaxID=1088818 RepID=A0A2I0AG52_9ASPA|nr:Lipoxygenase 6, chloroplastic [Apostasia shenzhenica]